jgi:hypothetical protein
MDIVSSGRQSTATRECSVEHMPFPGAVAVGRLDFGTMPETIVSRATTAPLTSSMLTLALSLAQGARQCRQRPFTAHPANAAAERGATFGEWIGSRRMDVVVFAVAFDRFRVKIAGTLWRSSTTDA